MKVNHLVFTVFVACFFALTAPAIAQYVPKSDFEAQLTRKLLVVENVKYLSDLVSFSCANPIYGEQNELLSIEIVGFHANANGYLGFYLMPKSTFSFKYENGQLVSIIYNDGVCTDDYRDYRVVNGDFSTLYIRGGYISTGIDKATLTTDAASTDDSSYGGGIWKCQQTIVEYYPSGAIKAVKEIEKVSKGKDARSAELLFSYCLQEKTFDESNPANYKLVGYYNKSKAKDADQIRIASGVTVNCEGNKAIVSIVDLKSNSTENFVWTYNENHQAVLCEQSGGQKLSTMKFEYNELGFISLAEHVTRNSDGTFYSHTQSELNYLLKDNALAGSYVCSYKIQSLNRFFNVNGEATHEILNTKKRTRNADGSWSNWVQLGY